MAKEQTSAEQAAAIADAQKRAQEAREALSGADGSDRVLHVQALQNAEADLRHARESATVDE